MTDEQFAELTATLDKLYAIQEETCGVLGEANHYLKTIAGSAQQQTGTGGHHQLAPGEHRDHAQLYAVCRRPSGDLGIMLYTTDPGVLKPTGKLHGAAIDMLAQFIEINAEEPVWTQTDADYPSRDLLEATPGYLRPLGGTLSFVKREQAGRSGRNPSKPIVRITGFTPDGEPGPIAAPPRRLMTHREVSAPAVQTPAESAGHRAPPAPTQEAVALKQAASRYRLILKAALRLHSNTDLPAAMDFVTAKWASMQDPPIMAVRTDDLTADELDQLAKHVGENIDRWQATWALARGATTCPRQ